MKTKQYVKVGFVFAAAAIALALVSCGTTKSTWSTQGDALGGVFEVRDMPASNPAGLNMDITLNDDFTFELSSWFGDNPQAVNLESGTFTWRDEAAGIIELGLQNEDLRLYQIDNGNLIHLMSSGDRFAEDGHILTRR